MLEKTRCIMGNAQVACNRGKSVDTRVCFPCSTLGFFCAGKFKAVKFFFGVGFEKTSYATSRQLSRSLLLNFFT